MNPFKRLWDAVTRLAVGVEKLADTAERLDAGINDQLAVPVTVQAAPAIAAQPEAKPSDTNKPRRAAQPR
jgi:hypothetical protein